MFKTVLMAGCVLVISATAAQADNCAQHNPAAAFFMGWGTGDPGAYWRVMQHKCAAMLMQQEYELRQLQIEELKRRHQEPARRAPPREIYVSK